MNTTANVSERMTGDNRMKRQVKGYISRPHDSGGDWIQGMHMQRGALHEHLGIPAGQKIPAARLDSAARSGSPKIRREANLAETFRKMQRGK